MRGSINMAKDAETLTMDYAENVILDHCSISWGRWDNVHIKDAKNIVFCFGAKLPDPKMLAVRPRSIGVCETDTHFVISFMEAPNLALTKIMIDWVEELFNQ